MQLNITARHLKLTPAIHDYVEKKLNKAKRFLDNLIWAQVILDVSKNRHIAEIVLHTSGRTFTAQEEGADLYAAIDLASDKLDEQLRRFKEKRRSRRGVETPRRSRTHSAAPEWFMAHPGDLPEGPDPRISSMRRLRLSETSINSAIAAMEQSDSAHWIFINADSSRVTVVYRKPDKTFGVVEALT